MAPPDLSVRHSRWPAILGATGAVLFLALSHYGLRNHGIVLLGTFLACTAVVYPAAALAQHAVRNHTGIEIVFALGVLALAVLGLTLTPYALVAGYVLHGCWDWLHHAGRLGVKVVRWFPPACAAFDFVLAGLILFAPAVVTNTS